ncbi:hypothetical protein ACFFLM_15450 [Deinococcus oregonensis]|uniref:Uncharacterized protein n=1 Tax=Deinococcus oregonensis TaxID=1805970 RepID=A0ABV6B0U5_9DEIO
MRLTRKPRWPWAAALICALLLACVIWALEERRGQGALYCIERPGTLWNGLAPLPSTFTPECPPSQSYRQEVRAGESRVESYRVAGWQPRALLPLLRQGGYRQITDEPIGPGTYSAFLGRSTLIELHYVAAQQGDTTLITISGRP